MKMDNIKSLREDLDNFYNTMRNRISEAEQELSLPEPEEDEGLCQRQVALRLGIKHTQNFHRFLRKVKWIKDRVIFTGCTRTTPTDYAIESGWLQRKVEGSLIEWDYTNAGYQEIKRLWETRNH